MISINNITFYYQQKRPVLYDFSLRFEAGGTYGLLGKNGTGKSTLLYLMTGLLRPLRGEVTYNDVPTWQRKPEVLKDFFLVPEEYTLPAIPLRRYVKALMPFYPLFSQELLESSLQNFGMPLNMNMGELSMGQKKKVYMSLALAANTKVLLLDEPTNGLDILSKSQFRKALVGGMDEGKTIIISTHQVHDVENLLDHVVIVDTNRVLLKQAYDEDNRPADLEKLFVETLTKNTII
ncbi:MAG: ATP-binding cassette domain-containing protein [Prevotellaceae bacterium]|nr:ATP-binding cassette domain-containing protein [Prevotellaceae bacterium]